MPNMVVSVTTLYTQMCYSLLNPQIDMYDTKCIQGNLPQLYYTYSICVMRQFLTSTFKNTQQTVTCKALEMWLGYSFKLIKSANDTIFHHYQ